MAASPYVAGLSVLTDDEADLGAAVIEMGAGSTTIATYSGGRFVHASGFALGGQHVTMNDVARLWSAGFARGASFENTVVLDDARLLNTEGLRFSDECARHKALDAVGDLTLAGLPLLGAYRSVRGGHKLNHAVLTALLADRSAWRVVEAEPARRPRGYVEAGAGMVGGLIAPAYGPDVS